MFNVLISCYKIAQWRSNDSPVLMAAQDPWGERPDNNDSSTNEPKPKKPDQPPDLDELFNKLLNRVPKKGGGGSGGNRPSMPNINFSGKTVGLIIGAVIAVWLATGVYTVQERENGVELLLGKHSGTTTSGLNWHWPYPIGQVEKVDVQSISTMRIGEFRTQKSSVSTSSQRDGQMLTSDENIVEIGAAVQYRISNAENYLFVANEPEKVLEDIVISAIREVVGASTVDEVLRDRRNEWPQEAKSIITTTLNDFGIGFEIIAFELQDARAPAEVQDAFEDAVRAREDEERLRLKAEAYALERLPVARGQAEQHIQDAMAYQARVLAQANANVSRFNNIYKAYLLDKMAMRDRMYLDTMSQVYGNSQAIIIDSQHATPIINLGQGENQQHNISPAKASAIESSMTTTEKSNRMINEGDAALGSSSPTNETNERNNLRTRTR